MKHGEKVIVANFVKKIVLTEKYNIEVVAQYWLLSQLNDCTVDLSAKNMTGSTYYKKNDNIIFEHDGEDK